MSENMLCRAAPGDDLAVEIQRDRCQRRRIHQRLHLRRGRFQLGGALFDQVLRQRGLPFFARGKRGQQSRQQEPGQHPSVRTAAANGGYRRVGKVEHHFPSLAQRFKASCGDEIAGRGRRTYSRPQVVRCGHVGGDRGRPGFVNDAYVEIAQRGRRTHDGEIQHRQHVEIADDETAQTCAPLFGRSGDAVAGIDRKEYQQAWRRGFVASGAQDRGGDRTPFVACADKRQAACRVGAQIESGHDELTVEFPVHAGRYIEFARRSHNIRSIFVTFDDGVVGQARLPRFAFKSARAAPVTSGAQRMVRTAPSLPQACVATRAKAASEKLSCDATNTATAWTGAVALTIFRSRSCARQSARGDKSRSVSRISTRTATWKTSSVTTRPAAEGCRDRPPRFDALPKIARQPGELFVEARNERERAHCRKPATSEAGWSWARGGLS